MTPYETQVRELARTGRITTDDAHRLVEALGPREPRWMWLVNPFDRLSTTASWTIAVLVWLASVGVVLLGVRFDGALDVHVAGRAPSLGLALFDLVNSVVLTSIVLWLTGLAFARQGRLVDYVAGVSIARAPLVLTALVALWIMPPPAELLAMVQRPPIVPPARVLVGSLLTILGVVWFVALLNRGFRVSSGLRGATLGLAFTLGLIAAEVVTKLALIVVRPRFIFP